MKTPKILFVVPSLSRAGAEKQVVDLANGLGDAGFSCHLTSFEINRDQLDRLDAETVNYHPLTRRRKFDLGVATGIAQLIDEHQIDILHCTLSIGIFYGFLAARKAARSPVVIAGVHTTLSRNIKDEFLERFVYRYQLRSTDRVVFVCHRQMDYWLRRDPKLGALSTVVYNGVDHVEFDRSCCLEESDALRRSLGIGRSDSVVCCVAAFRPEKAQGNIVNAIARLRDSHPDLHLLLAGQGAQMPVVVKLVRDLRIEDRVHFLGKLNDVRPVLAASDLSIIASVAVETFSFAMLESMSMSTPVLSTRIGGAEEAVIPGRTGSLVPPNDITALAHGLGKLLDDPAKIRQYGKYAREMVEKKFSYAKMIATTAELMNVVLSERERYRG